MGNKIEDFLTRAESHLANATISRDEIARLLKLAWLGYRHVLNTSTVPSGSMVKEVMETAVSDE